ncbi:unannotated protein [freshwater metagenome]|uniref:UDP-MurNAc-pentapeptide synthetase n=1 Tax=freshwater metagenome TaxID=449393 RepID=A0A6J6N0C9_9ZZZZ|nr:UDP-N-acetylmuramoyl-tripeptide--D-alanyl-D-alanine ligase [Actinomycetota bacterium]
MIAMSVAEIAEILGGTVHRVDTTVIVNYLVTDSRQAVPGAMFVAIRGENLDGHDFAASAIGNGASVVLAGRELDVPCIVVADPVLALGALARWVREHKLSCKVIAITGSSGKTSTKDLLAQVLTAAGSTVAAVGSFNTEVGVPLTILRADEATQFLVLEMGMRGSGHLTYLTDISSPDIAAIVNIGSAHVGVVGTQEMVARAKGEIIAALPRDGIAVLNFDDAMVMEQADRTVARVVTCGEAVGSDIRATDVRLDDQARPAFTLVIEDLSVPVTLLYHGRHFVSNALVAAGIAFSLGVNIETIAMALRAATPASKWRMEVHQLPRGITLINDAYNANPESVRAAIDTLVAMAAGRRTWIVLGEMRELGANSEAEHTNIGIYAAENGIDELMCIGEGARPAVLGAGEVSAINNTWVADSSSAISALESRLVPGDVVLIKASRGVGLDVVASALMQLGAA